jgi:Mrp family chromosome partitioning ATPase
MGGLRVLMIEGVLRMRSLSELVGVNGGGADLIAALASEIDWRGALLLDPATQAHILPAMAAGPTLGNPFASARMRKMLEEARAEYDLIILDCPPVLAIADARSLCGVADGTLMVSSWNATPAPAVRTAVRAIEGAGGRIIGVILNRLHPALTSRLSYGDALYDGASSAGYFAG